MQKTAKVTEVAENVREWQNPKGGSIFYHTITLDNGDRGEIGKKQRGAIKAGDEITYTIESTEYGNKIKAVQNFNGNNSGAFARRQGSPATFALSYCKDICVAMIPLHPEKTPTDWTATCLAMADKFSTWLKEHE